MDVNPAEVKTTSIPTDSKYISDIDSKKQAKTHEVKPGTQTISANETEEIVKSLEIYMNVLKTNIGFRVNTETDRVVVTITNQETNEVIRQIPSEELISLQERMKELTGIIFSETV
jgi:flagellar protein FlaG